MGRTSQRKDAGGETELSKILTENGIPCQRGGGMFGEFPDIVGVYGVHIECKRTERLNIYEAFLQSQYDANATCSLPTVFHRRNRSDWLVTMNLSDWITFYKTWFKNTNKPD